MLWGPIMGGSRRGYGRRATKRLPLRAGSLLGMPSCRTYAARPLRAHRLDVHPT
jgi:hypothetical protein